MESKKISIIMPVYNGEKYLSESVASLLNQTYGNFELIIINDSSTDGSKDLAQRLAESDSRIKVIDNKYEKGLFGALNTGLDATTGEYIARADADDLNRRERLESQVEFLNKHAEIDIIGGGFQLFGMGTNKKIFAPQNSYFLAWKYLCNTYFCHPTVMFRKSVLATIPHYPKTACEDFAFFSEILKKHKGYNLRKILIDYRQHDKNYSNTDASPIKQSVMETYKQNFMYYTGSLAQADIFYNFHARQDLELKNAGKVFKIGLKIIHKISKQYGEKFNLINFIYLGSILKIEILKSLFRHYFKNLKNN